MKDDREKLTEHFIVALPLLLEKVSCVAIGSNHIQIDADYIVVCG